MSTNPILFIPPSIIFSSIVLHYEWYDVSKGNNIEEFAFHPSFSTGLIFIFYRGKRMYATNTFLEKRELSETVLLPPTSLLTFNKEIDDLTIFRVIFQPGGLYYTFDVPMSEFHNELVDSSLDLDKELEFLHERMYESPIATNCVYLFEEYLKKKLHYHSQEVPVLFQKSLHKIMRTGLNIKAEDLAKELGKSHSQLNILMNRELGFSTKKFLMINRFCESLQILNKSEKVNLTQLAWDLGFSNPGHFSNVFREMAGFSPKKYLKRLGKEDWEGFLDAKVTGVILNRHN